jgi:hypothetical protein
LIIKSTCDAEGNLIFTEDDLEMLSKKSSKVLEKLAKAAQRLNGIGEDTPEKK